MTSKRYLSDEMTMFNYTNSDILVPMELQFTYTFLEVIVAIVAVIGNAMVILVFRKEKRLRRRTNYYIVSLAVADLLVGLLGIPFAILASVGLPSNLHACLFTVSLLVVLCTISIFCLVAVSVDRYWAILHPMDYSRNVRTQTTIIIISLCWVAGAIVGFLPLFGWHADASEHVSCFFVMVMDYDYLVFLYFATIITPSLIMAAFYAHIYRVVVKQLKQIVTINPVGSSKKFTHSKKANSNQGEKSCRSDDIEGSGTMLRVLGAAQKREVKATQNLSIIVLFFMLCWIPLYTINCVKAFCPKCHIAATWTDFCIILSHLNSAVNPVLYAYHLKDFRAALKKLIYKMFGLKDDHPSENYYKPSLISQTNRNLEKRCSNQHSKIYIDSPIWLRQQQAMATANLNSTSSGPFDYSLNTDMTPSTFEVEEKQKRKMWMISEIPSIAEDDTFKDDLAIISQNNDAQCCSKAEHVIYTTSDGEALSDAQFELSDRYGCIADVSFHMKNRSTCSSCESDEENDSDNDSVLQKSFNANGIDSKSSNLCQNLPIYCVENNNLDFHEDTSKKDKLLPLNKIEGDKMCASEGECSSLESMMPFKILSGFMPNKTCNYNASAAVKAQKNSSPDVFQYLDLHKHCASCNENDLFLVMDPVKR